MTRLRNKDKPAAIRVALPFAFRHWRTYRGLAAFIVTLLLGATVADLFMPLFAGRLVDAVTQGAASEAARQDALFAFLGIVALGVGSMVMRYFGLQAIVPFTLSIMSDIAREAFGKVQRFSTDWHANTFAGSTVRKVTRGMWAVDVLNDTLMMSLFPSFVVLVGSMVILGLHWPVLGVVIGCGAVAYIAMTAWLSVNYIGPAARLSNAWDSRIGGALADAITCNTVVKSFGNEEREDARLSGVVGKWRKRVRRTWRRYTIVSTAQLVLLWIMRGGVVGGALLFWMGGRATPGDVAYVLSMSFIIHGYLRDVGQQARPQHDQDENDR